MLEGLIDERKARKVVEPQLISLIAILSMLILFIIAGTIFGSATIKIPTHYDLAVGSKKQDIAPAPQVTFLSRGFKLSFSDDKVFPYQILQTNTAAANKRRQKLQKIVRQFLSQKKDDDSRKSLNVVAEKSTTYKVIFDVLQELRSSGFVNILFVARYEGQSGG